MADVYLHRMLARRIRITDIVDPFTQKVQAVQLVEHLNLDDIPSGMVGLFIGRVLEAGVLLGIQNDNTDCSLSVSRDAASGLRKKDLEKRTTGQIVPLGIGLGGGRSLELSDRSVRSKPARLKHHLLKPKGIFGQIYPHHVSNKFNTAVGSRALSHTQSSD
jgi:hypothetical protein